MIFALFCKALSERCACNISADKIRTLPIIKHSTIMKKNKIKRVLIAMDYDPTSKMVAENGFAMAKKYGAEVTLLHVLVDLSIYSAAYASMGEWQIDTLNMFDTDEMKNAGSRNFLEKGKRYLGDTAVKTLLKTGDSAQMILKSAQEMNVDYIVIGSHSQKCLENILMGSVTEKVLRNATIPLFIVPTKQPNDFIYI